MNNKLDEFLCPDCKGKLELHTFSKVQLRCSNPECNGIYELYKNNDRLSDEIPPNTDSNNVLKFFIEGSRDAVQEAVSIIQRNYMIVSEPISYRKDGSSNLEVCMDCVKITK